jgi:hypothetical protein
MEKIPAWVKVLVFLTCWPAAVLATPVYVAEADGARIVLTDEPCEVKAVSNLPYKAVWTEKGKDFTGCWAPRPNEGIVMGYFAEDRTVVVIPIQAFKRVTGT